MPTERPCGACGRPYEAKRPNSRYCSDTCRKRAQRSGKAEKPAAPSVTNADASPLYLATLAELEAAGLAESRVGQQALTLAERMGGDFDTGSARAALSKELDRLVDKALASVPAAMSRVDEMKARRDAKRNRATAG